METGKCKRNYLKEILINKPWVYFPDVIKFMRKYPYNRENCYFWTWLRNCFYVNWQVCLED